MLCRIYKLFELLVYHIILTDCSYFVYYDSLLIIWVETLFNKSELTLYKKSCGFNFWIVVFVLIDYFYDEYYSLLVLNYATIFNTKIFISSLKVKWCD